MNAMTWAILITIGNFIADYWLALLACYITISVTLIAREARMAKRYMGRVTVDRRRWPAHEDLPCEAHGCAEEM